jgi:2-polyprenyl-3-methyl-5-hydroxy-6-metoxy-1,4-benzoquinol methylase
MATQALGKSKLTLVDRIGAHLSLAPIARVVRRYDMPAVLDIGCGHRAHVLLALAPHIREGIGIDESVSDQAKTTPKLAFLEGPAEERLAELAHRSFDVVLLISVLEHLVDPVAALAMCHALLRPGGTLVVNVPNWQGKVFLELSAFRFKTTTADSIDDHKMYYGKRDLWPLLVRAGFRPSRIHMRTHKLGLNLFATAQKPAD